MAGKKSSGQAWEVKLTTPHIKIDFCVYLSCAGRGDGSMIKKEEGKRKEILIHIEPVINIVESRICTVRLIYCRECVSSRFRLDSKRNKCIRKEKCGFCLYSTSLQDARGCVSSYSYITSSWCWLTFVYETARGIL